MRFVPVLLLALLDAAATHAAPRLAPPSLADCHRTGHSQALATEAVGRPRHARAAWLDGRHLRWAAPPRPATSRSVLLELPPSGGAIRVGARPPVNTRIWALQPATLPAPSGRRFSHIDGETYAVQAPEFSLEEALRGELFAAILDSAGQIQQITRIQAAGALDALYAEKALALTYWPTANDRQATLRLWAPTALSVAVCVYPDAVSGATEAYPLTRDDSSGSWSTQLPGDWRNAYYTYLVDVRVPGLGLVRQRVTDPYSLGLSTQSQRSQWIDLDDPSTQPAGWTTTPRPRRVLYNTDLVIYELHVRDFSRDDATVPAAHRGKYLAFDHTGSDGMRHLRRLGDAGITDVHLLPTYDLATVPEQHCTSPELPTGAASDSPAVQAVIAPVRERDCFNWGYDPLHYTVPEGSYASDPSDSRVRVREFRALVQALHRANLRVGLDVVYNHTMAAGQDALSVLDRIVPGYYHRLDAEGAVATSTCCANTATENAMMAKLMIDSAVVWARDYRIDSFRFDLMGHQPKAAMLALQAAVDAAAGQRIHLIGEGWNFGEVANGARFEQASQLSLQGSGIATFSDRLRDAARGGGAGDRGTALFRQGWLTGLHTAPNSLGDSVDSAAALASAADRIRIGLAGTLRDVTLTGADGVLRPLSGFAYGDQPAGYAAEPGEVVNYTENHDNLTLFDSNLLRLPRDMSGHERARVQVLGNALVLLAQGVAYLHAGQELLRSKSLDRNSYNSGDAFNRLDWSLSTNHFGTGLPPAWDNEDSWPQMRPLLANAVALMPTPADIRFTVAATEDLLRVRASTRLLRLPSSAEVQRRLRWLNTGHDANHAVIAAHLDGGGLPDAGFAAVLYAINAAPTTQVIHVGDFASQGWRLHPELRVDARLSGAQFDSQNGTLALPGRSAAVFVRD